MITQNLCLRRLQLLADKVHLAPSDQFIGYLKTLMTEVAPDPVTKG
jgi:hypothetical protein